MSRQVLTLPDVPSPPLLTQTQANALFVKLAGDTMTGNLTIATSSPPILGLRQSADANNRAQLGQSNLIFGPGNTAADVTLSRTGVGLIATNSEWDTNLTLRNTSAFVFRHGANNFGTPIYAQFGYGGDGNNPRMQFGCNAWFAQYGSSGSRPTPTKQVSGLASGIIIVEAGGSGGQPSGMVPLTDFIWQDGGWTTGYWTAARLYNGGSMRFRGDSGDNTAPEAWVNVRPITDGGVYFMARGDNRTTPTRLGQFYAGAYTYLSANAYYLTPDWKLDDTTQDGVVAQLGAQTGGDTFVVNRFMAGSNPATGRMKTPLRLSAAGALTLTADAAGVALQFLTTGATYSHGFIPAQGSDTSFQWSLGGYGTYMWQNHVTTRPNFDNVYSYGDSTHRLANVYLVSLHGGAGSIYLRGTGAVYCSMTQPYLAPETDAGQNLGYPGVQRWANLYIYYAPTVGSHADMKEDFSPLDPEACVEAVRDTDWINYSYLKQPAPQRREDETDEAWEERQVAYQQTLIDTDFSRHQKGYALGHPKYRVAGLFGLSDRKNRSDGSDIAVVACALQQALREIEELKARLSA